MAIGAGLQGTVALVNIFCYYIIGIPFGLVLAYVAHLQVKVRNLNGRLVYITIQLLHYVSN